MRISSLLFLSLFTVSAYAQQVYGDQPLAHTYSIVAYDPNTGEMGAAVQSHWFSVGSMVIWGEPGVGVVATQSFVNPNYGPEGLRLLKIGIAPVTVVGQLTSRDNGRDYRQVAVLNAKGAVDAFTGKNCIDAAGHYVGENFSVQANLMDNDSVWIKMARAYEGAAGLPLAERMMAALEAGQAAGGDIRGQQSAAMIVVSGDAKQPAWKKEVDLRVEDSQAPLVELKRLLQVHRAYEHMNKGDLAVEKGDQATALKEYAAAEALFPDNLEMKYWHAVALVNMDKLAEALPLFAQVFQKDEKWRTLTPRLIDSELLKVDEAQLQQILNAGK
ncbi:MAG TPA: DUF1028 domain-containing protein [Saprospiraceae bacterium]|nr:DUF1028 domain-containing protein [Saprospiraceae bacterium]HMQ85448.1 DUF1028 domain-containing protein [Saprospiraceae bacterium]